MQSIRGFYPQTLKKSQNLRTVSPPKPNQKMSAFCYGHRNQVSQNHFKKDGGRMQSRSVISSENSLFYSSHRALTFLLISRSQ